MEAGEFKKALKGSFEVRADGATWRLRCKVCGVECVVLRGKEPLEALHQHAREHKNPS